MPTSFTVNGTSRQADVRAATPLLCVLRNDLAIGSPQFGCGLSQCGACSVLLDGKEVRSCVLAVGSVADKQVTEAAKAKIETAFTSGSSPHLCRCGTDATGRFARRLPLKPAHVQAVLKA